MKYKKSIVWLRRDLRLKDNHALSIASQKSEEITLIFIFDINILQNLTNNKEKRISFIIDSLIDLQNQLKKYQTNIKIYYGDPKEIILDLSKEYNAIFLNKDYDPYSRSRDAFLRKKIKNFHEFKDHVIFEEKDILKNNKIIINYKNYRTEWVKNFNLQQEYSSNGNYSKTKESFNRDSLSKLINFDYVVNDIKGGETIALEKLLIFKNKINNYEKDRDNIYKNGTSNLSTYIRFGNISIRQILIELSKSSIDFVKFKDEIIWRDYYHQILYHFPRNYNQAFNSKWNKFEWENNEFFFECWKNGETGFLLVDAAMRCLNETGLMHNRLRMLCANFLTKILLVDWKYGERYFAEKLLDYDLAANNGGWQWSAGVGFDNVPYIRIFNPLTQIERFDPNKEFIKKWIEKEINPIVDYKERRKYSLNKLQKFISSN